MAERVHLPETQAHAGDLPRAPHYARTVLRPARRRRIASVAARAQSMPKEGLMPKRPPAISKELAEALLYPPKKRKR